MTTAPAYARVLVDIAAGQTDRPFTYRIPDGMILLPGQRVLVPFGPRKMEGVVLSVESASEVAPGKLKSVLAPMENYAAVPEHLMALAQDMARENQCPLAMTVRLMLPAAMRRGRIQIKTQKAVRLLLDKAAWQAAAAGETRSPKRRLLLEVLSDGALHPVDDLKPLVNNPLAALKDMARRGWVALTDEEIYRSPFEKAFRSAPPPPLTEEQQEVLGEILPAMQKGQGRFLLYGVTGSGKTEVYMRAVSHCLAMGKGAVVLVPEIALTPQMTAWFRERFGDVAAVLHSKLSDGEKFDEWRRILRGEARVVIGARSAVFAPVRALGLIIVDEEHEVSYVSDHMPVYDARRVAQMRCDREGAALILASATPSILSFAHAREGQYMLLEMPSRVNRRPLPTVEVVDMCRELTLGNQSMFSGLLQQKLAACLARGEQAILFVNRRGYAPSVVCRKCGHTLKCDQCDVAQTYHKEDNALHCHYCGGVTPYPEACPACGSKYLKPCGVGTQKVQEAFEALFPGVPVVRLDADTTSKKNGHEALFDIFRSGKARVMIGTQMIAKGLDFPMVTLVGCMLADLTVNLPDYRAPEKTFQLLTQAAGRAGRAERPGEVIIQTYKPRHYAICLAARQDYRAYFEEEFSRRRRQLYPPFTKLVRILCTASAEEEARALSRQLYAGVLAVLDKTPAFKKRVLFIREDDAPIKRIMGRCRAQVFMKLVEHPDAALFLKQVQRLVDELPPSAAQLEINPQSLA